MRKMGTTIHLVTEPLYREPLRKKLLTAGFTAQLHNHKKFGKDSRNQSSQLYVVQAHLWREYKHSLSDFASIVMLGTPSWFYCWFKAVSKHACAYVTPFDPPNAITASIKQVSQRNHYLSATITELLNAERKKRQERLLDTELSSHLTERELEVLALVGEQHTTTQIAERCFRSVETIKTHRKNIRRKVGAANGERLAVLAGRKVYALKTLLSIEKNAEMLDKLCENTLL
jgi:DNA-binding NarL/FixJ family response regulator